jgi:hypothetical protein
LFLLQQLVDVHCSDLIVVQLSLTSAEEFGKLRFLLRHAQQQLNLQITTVGDGRGERELDSLPTVSHGLKGDIVDAVEQGKAQRG